MLKTVFGLTLFASLAAFSAPVTGRYVRCSISRPDAILTLAEVEVYENDVNVALGGIASQRSTAWGGDAVRAIDGNRGKSWADNTMTHTREHAGAEMPWWEVDLKVPRAIEKISVWNRPEMPDRLDGLKVMILDENRVIRWSAKIDKAERTENPLAVDDATPGADAGKSAPRPAAPEELLKSYEKRGTWIETLAALAGRQDLEWSPAPLVPRLVADFPEAAGEIVAELNPSLHSSASFALGYPALALGYAARFSDPAAAAEWRKRAPQVKSAAEFAELRKAYRADRAAGTARERLKWFDAAAFRRALAAWAQKYPAAYPDREALSKAIDEAEKLVAGAKGSKARELEAASAIEGLVKNVFLRHPAIDFKRILMVRRNRKFSHSGFPQNWQGNSSIPLHGYLNDIVSVPLLQTADAEEREIVASDSFLGDVDLDFDAGRIAYSGGVGGEQGWRIMETPLDAPGTRKELSPATWRDIDYYDPCYLPDGRMLFVATSGFHGVPCVGGSDLVGNTHLLEKDGSVKRLVFDQDNSWCPVVMNNGRILYLRWEYTDSAHYFSRVMMTMNPDGSDQKAFYGSNSYWPNSLFYARPLPGSVTKFCGIVSGHHGLARQGELVVFDITKGRRETEGAVQRIPGFGLPVEGATRDELVKKSRPLFVHPYPLSEELFLVAVHRNPGEPFMIALADVYDNIVPLWRLEDVDLVEPLPLVAREKPQLPVDRRDDSKKTCTVYLQGVGNGEGLKGVPRGVPKKLRIFQYSYSPRWKGGHYTIGFEGPWDPRSIIGEVDLEKDGSCLFTVPANTPIALQPLDANGRKLQEMRSWFVGVPGETLSCIGCHENQNDASPPSASLAMRKQPQTPKLWYGPRRNWSFDREVQPVLDAKCVGCHNAKNAQARAIPDFEGRRGKGAWEYSVSYVNLMPYVRRNGPEGDYHLLTPLEFHADTSELVQLLEKGHHGVKLTGEEMDRIVTWMDLNVPFWGSWSDRYPGDGRMKGVLARRREMALAWAGDDYDPEAVANPYVPGTAMFVAPEKPAAPAAPPAVDGWPFDAAAALKMQGEKRFETLELGGGVKLELARIPAGSFAMGSNELTPAERPVHRETVAKSFLMGVTEITQRQMRLMDPSFDNGVYDMHYKDQVKRGYYMGDQDPEFAQPGHEDFPAVRVSWNDANRFCQWLSKKTGRKVRLPTEAEWEWACRAGTATLMNYGGLDDDFSKRENLADRSFIELAVTSVDPKPIARADDPNPKNRPNALWDYELRDARSYDGFLHLAPAGSFEPNAWGLKDMHGNAAEWTSSDWRRDYGAGVADGELKTVRGGSWYRRQKLAASAVRWRYPAWMRPFDVGFRGVVED